MLIKEDFEIKIHTSFKIGGKIAKVYFPENSQEFAKVAGLPVIGNLSNTLVSSDGYDGEIVSTAKLDYIRVEGNRIIAGAGVKGPKLSQIAVKNGLSGLEFMIGFPGSVGGEVFMNAGAHGQEVSDTFKSAKIYFENSLKTIEKKDMNFGYRKSVCAEKNYTVLEAEFELKPEIPKKIKQKMTENLEFRKTHQPSLALPNCGSIFKNPDGNSAGKLLDECGVKGLQVGDAKVWENHANFIINTKNASSTDVLQLMSEMQNRVIEKFGIKLVPEIKYLGNNKEEVELCKNLKVL